MPTYIDAKKFGLPSRTLLEEVDPHLMALVINRKSRILMKDGAKIIEKVGKIRAQLPGIQVVLKTTAPVCSKTIRLLKEEQIDIIPAP